MKAVPFARKISSSPWNGTGLKGVGIGEGVGLHSETYSKMLAQTKLCRSEFENLKTLKRYPTFIHSITSFQRNTTECQIKAFPLLSSTP